MDTIPTNNGNNDDRSLLLTRKLLIHWKGEIDVGYTKPFRHLEFMGALAAELNLPTNSMVPVEFVNALQYHGVSEMVKVHIENYNDSMQYISFMNQDNILLNVPNLRTAIIAAAQRSSLVHGVYEVVAKADSYNDLAQLALDDGGFDDMFTGQENENLTWCFRVRYFGDDMLSPDKEKRYGSRARSLTLEKEGLKALKQLLIKLHGDVDLMNPDCKIYVFDGMKATEKILTRRISVGPKSSSMAPSTRLCVTNTPLCPIAAFSLCNVARIRNEHTVLDTYAGSCATLLAAAMIAPNCKTVGIEIAHGGIVNRDDIRRDFSTRNLKEPVALIRGDFTKDDIRQQAKDAIQGNAFDCIVADPPYGIRETTSYSDQSPLEELFASIAHDRMTGNRLLKKGGRLVVFVPVTDEETLSEMMPNQDLTDQAGLQFEVSREQPLNEKLSRWLVSFIAIK